MKVFIKMAIALLLVSGIPVARGVRSRRGNGRNQRLGGRRERWIGSGRRGANHQCGDRTVGPATEYERRRTFLVTLLPPGTYSVVVNKTGFSEAKAVDIQVRVTETTRLTVPLKPGTVSEKIEITAEVAAVDTTNATTGESIGSTTVRSLPLATQNFQQLLTLSAGAQSDLNNSTQLGRGRCAHDRERPARRQQQLPDRRNQRHGLQRGGTDEHAAAEPGRDPGIQGTDLAVRCDARPQWRWKHQCDSENRNAAITWRRV